MPVAIQNQSRLYLDSARAELIIQLQNSAKASGWEPGLPLMGFAWRWSSTIPYLLEAQVPPFTMPTIFYMESGLELGKYNIRYHLRNFPSDKAWLLIDDLQGLDSREWNTPWDWSISKVDNRTFQVKELVDFFVNKIGRQFPNDYILAAKVGDIELWKPK